MGGPPIAAVVANSPDAAPPANFAVVVGWIAGRVALMSTTDRITTPNRISRAGPVMRMRSPTAAAVPRTRPTTNGGRPTRSIEVRSRRVMATESTVTRMSGIAGSRSGAKMARTGTVTMPNPMPTVLCATEPTTTARVVSSSCARVRPANTGHLPGGNARDGPERCHSAIASSASGSRTSLRCGCRPPRADHVAM